MPAHEILPTSTMETFFKDFLEILEETFPHE